jgi:sugar/nucleoside kinase (ribokinase family)
MRMFRARIAGHICVDLIPALAGPVPGPGHLAQAGPIEVRLGGCVASTGAALAALGAPVELVALLSDDLLGDAAATLLEGVAVDGLRVRRIAGSATSYSVVLQPPGLDRTFVHHIGTNAAFDGRDVAVDHTDLLHVGYPQLLPRLLDDTGAGLANLLGRARADGVTTSVDFATVDPARAADHPWPALVRRWAPLIDVATPSVDDLRPAFEPVLSSSADMADAVRLADELVRAGTAIALVTAGRAGMCLRTADAQRFHRGGRVLAGLAHTWADRQLWAPPGQTAPTRTTGAGDTAAAGFLYALLAGLTAEQAVRLAAGAAALHVSGVEPLPAWADGHRAYDNVVLTEAAIDGWTAGQLGLLHGPVDRKGIA